jgi:Flp pilus assembly protein TadB
MQLLTALPVAGPGLATLVGLGPDLGDPVVEAMLVAGFGATALGWWWARRLVARADLPVRVARAPSR